MSCPGSLKELIDVYNVPDPLEDPDEKFVHKVMPISRATLGMRWVPTRLPCGRFELELKDGFVLKKAVLEYHSGVLRIIAGDAELKIIQSIDSLLLLIEDPANIIVSVTPRPAWEWVGEKLEKVGFESPEIFDDADSSGWRQSCPEDPGITASCYRMDYGFAVSLTLDGEKEPAIKADAEKDKAKTFWSEYFSAIPEVNLPDQFLNEFYKFALYKFSCATQPGGYACALQGPWHEEYQLAQWSGDYHFNVNIQEIYTLAFASGCFEHLILLFDMLESEPFQQTMRNNARNLLGIDDGLLLTHAVDDRGMQCGGISSGSVLDFACGGWTAQLYWLYYKYTLDKEFLRKRAYPFIYGIMRVFEETLEEDEGRLSMPMSISAEYGVPFKIKRPGRYWSKHTGRDPSYQLACTHMLADMLIEASSELDIEPRPVWFDIKKRLPKYTSVGDAGADHVAIWDEQDLDICHRHHSHLACIYPFDTLKDFNEKDMKILDDSIDHWILKGMGQWSEWCYPWAAIIHARYGFKESPAILLEIWKNLFVNEGWATVYLPKFRGLSAHRKSDMLKPKETSEIMQLDGTMGGATAILEMLVHQKAGTVYVFPGIPDKWQDVSFKNVRLPGAFLISAERRNGQTANVIIKSLEGGSIKIKLSESSQAQIISFNAGEERNISI